MRRPLRRAVNGAAAASLLVCAGLLAMWVRGFWREDTVWLYPTPGRTVELTLVLGRDRNRLGVLEVFTSPPSSVAKRRRRYPRPPVFRWRSDPAQRWDGWDYPNYGERRWGRFSRWGWDIPARPAARPDDDPNDPNRYLYNAGDVFRYYTYPAWLLPAVAAAFGPLPAALGLGRWRRRRRRREKCCVRCGYDLRATPGRCPECGAAPATTKAPG